MGVGAQWGRRASKAINGGGGASPRALDFGISRAGFCKLPSSFHLMQPSYPLLQAVRHLEPSQPLSFLFPLRAPEGFSRPGRTARLRRRREKARGSEAQAAVPKAKANAEVGRSGEASLAQPYVHRSKLPLGGSFPCISPGRQPTDRGLEVEWEFVGRLHGEVTFGCSGQVGAVLSAPVVLQPPQISTKPPAKASGSS